MDKTLLLETTFEKPLLLTQKSNPNNNFYFTNYRLGIEDEPQITLDYNTFQKNSDNLTSHLFGLYSKAMLINTAQKMGIDARTKKDFEEKLREKFEVYANDLEKINEDEEWKELETKLLQRYNKTINQIILNGSVQKTLKDTSTINAFFQKLKAIINKCQQAIDIINLKLNMADEGEHIVDKSQLNQIEKDKRLIENGINQLQNLQKEAENLYTEKPIEPRDLFRDNSELLINKFIQNYHKTICLGVGLIYEQKAYEVCQDYFELVQHTGADKFINKNGEKRHDRKTDMIINELNISFKTISKGKYQNNTSKGTSVQSRGGVNSGGYLKEIVKDDKDLAAKVLSSQSRGHLVNFLRYTIFLKAIAGEKNQYQDDTIDIMIDNKHGVRLMGDVFSLLENNIKKANVYIDKVVKSDKFDSFDIKAQYFIKEKI